MARTVDDLRNEIRLAVGRYERLESTAFTKESLAAICEAVDDDIETNANGLPSKSRMRAGILRTVGDLDDDPDGVDRPFRKGELDAIAAALETDGSN